MWNAELPRFDLNHNQGTQLWIHTCTTQAFTSNTEQNVAECQLTWYKILEKTTTTEQCSFTYRWCEDMVPYSGFSFFKINTHADGLMIYVLSIRSSTNYSSVTTLLSKILSLGWSSSPPFPGPKFSETAHKKKKAWIKCECVFVLGVEVWTMNWGSGGGRGGGSTH